MHGFGKLAINDRVHIVWDGVLTRKRPLKSTELFFSYSFSGSLRPLFASSSAAELYLENSKYLMFFSTLACLLEQESSPSQEYP